MVNRTTPERQKLSQAVGFHHARQLEEMQDFAAAHGFKSEIAHDDGALFITIWYVVQTTGRTGYVKERARNRAELNAILGY